MSESQEFAAIIAGPRWWGEAQTDRDGNPCASKEAYARRKAQASREREIMQEVVSELPTGCFVIQGGARGADSLAATLCQARNINTAGVPFFKELGKRGGFVRNDMMAKLLNGLALQGFRVKVIVVQPPEGLNDGTKIMHDIATQMGIFVKKVVYDEPVPETEETA